MMPIIKKIGTGLFLCLGLYGAYVIGTQLQSKWQQTKTTDALAAQIKALEAKVSEMNKADVRPSPEPSSALPQAAEPKAVQVLVPTPGMTLPEFETLSREDPALEARIAKLGPVQPVIGPREASQPNGATPNQSQGNFPESGRVSLPDPGRVSLPDPGRTSLPD